MVSRGWKRESELLGKETRETGKIRDEKGREENDKLRTLEGE